MRQNVNGFIGAFLLFGLVACASPTIKDAVSSEFAQEGLHRVTSSGFEKAYVLPEANLSSYQRIHITPMQSADVVVTQTAVSGTTRQDWLMTPEREKNLKAAWDRATHRVFAQYSSDASGGSGLTVSSRLVRIIPGRTTGTSTTSAGVLTVGSSDTVDVEVEFRLTDDASNKLLAVIRDRRTIASLQWTRAAGVDMQNLFNSWAALLHTRISGK